MLFGRLRFASHHFLLLSPRTYTEISRKQLTRKQKTKNWTLWTSFLNRVILVKRVVVQKSYSVLSKKQVNIIKHGSSNLPLQFLRNQKNSPHSLPENHIYTYCNFFYYSSLYFKYFVKRCEVL